MSFILMSKATVTGLGLLASLGAGGAAAAATAQATPAIAATSGGVYLSTTGATFNGSYVFYAPGQNRGGFGYPGAVCDTLSDGNSPFVWAKTEGYGYGSKTYDNSGSGTCVYEANYVYDPSAVYVHSGTIQVCRDRGFFLPDNCATSRTYYR